MGTSAFSAFVLPAALALPAAFVLDTAGQLAAALVTLAADCLALVAAGFLALLPALTDCLGLLAAAVSDAWLLAAADLLFEPLTPAARWLVPACAAACFACCPPRLLAPAMLDCPGLQVAAVLAVLAAVAGWLGGLAAFVLLGVVPARPDARARVVTPMQSVVCCAHALVAAAVAAFAVGARPRVLVGTAGLLGPAMDQAGLRGDLVHESFGLRLLVLLLDSSAGDCEGVISTGG